LKRKDKHFRCAKLIAKGAVGILMWNDGAVEIINLLTFEVSSISSTIECSIISDPQYLNLSLTAHSLYHLLPADDFQFDCVPLISNVNMLPYCVLIIEVGKQININ
jgi:hypothetical protein